MNAIGGLCRLDPGPVDRDALRRMQDAAQLLVSCRRSSWAGGAVGLFCAAASVDDCSVGAELVRDARRRCVLVFDGRLDNRRELTADLRSYGITAESRDAELTLAAYEAWGDDAAKKLVGDYAFGLWDGLRRRLLCVRDPLGVRPLYFLRGKDFVSFATQLRQVWAGLRETPTINLEFIADRVAHGVDRADADITPYCGVSRLKPAHRLLAEQGRVRIERYWEWCAGDGISVPDQRDYVEEFRETFFEAVECRMRSNGSVWSDLSGGLDSSSVVSVAAENGRGRRLSTLSVVFGESTLSDEREWADAVARVQGVEQQYIDGDIHHPLSLLRDAVGYWDEPHAAAAFFAVHQEYGRLLGKGGVPTLLTGIGAEAVVMSKRQSPLYLADLLRAGQLRRLWRELDRWQRVRRTPLSNLAWRYCLRPLVTRPQVSYDWQPETHDWIERDFARRWELNARAKYGGMPSTSRSVAGQWHVEAVGRITGFLHRGYLEKACDIRYPFLHRPLVELALAAPWNLKIVPGEPKPLLRRAMRGVLPERIRRRTLDASTGHAVYAGLRKEWPALEELVASSLLIDLGVVNSERFQAALHLARQGHASDLGALVSALTLDAWLQNAAHKGDAAWVRSAA